jgi:mRNA interferase HigB
MHIISRKRLADFWSVHTAAEGPLSKWHTATEAARWKCFDDVRSTYNSADVVGDYVVFNVNNYRVIATVRYGFGKVFIAKVLTHSEYDRWKP